MIKQYVVFDSLGRILRHGNCVETDMEHQAYLPGQHVMEGTCNDLTDYIKDFKVLKRPECPATLEVNILKNVPVPAIVNIDGTAYDTDVPEVTLDMPIGKFKIKVIAFPYIEKEFELIV